MKPKTRLKPKIRSTLTQNLSLAQYSQVTQNPKLTRNSLKTKIITKLSKNQNSLKFHLKPKAHYNPHPN